MTVARHRTDFQHDLSTWLDFEVTQDLSHRSDLHDGSDAAAGDLDV